MFPCFGKVSNFYLKDVVLFAIEIQKENKNNKSKKTCHD